MPPGNFEILHALKCVLGAPEALFLACTPMSTLLRLLSSFPLPAFPLSLLLPPFLSFLRPFLLIFSPPSFSLSPPLLLLSSLFLPPSFQPPPPSSLFPSPFSLPPPPSSLFPPSFLPSPLSPLPFSQNVSVTFTSNTAGHAGAAIYAADIRVCTFNCVECKPRNNITQYQQSIFSEKPPFYFRFGQSIMT